MKRVLAIRLSAMGDIVHSIGAVRALAEARPDVELHYVVQRPMVPLFEGLDWLHSVIPHDRHPAVRGYVGTGRRLRQLGADVALDLQGNWKSAGLARLSGARLRIGAIAALRREPRSHILLNHLVGRSSDNAHPAALALAVVRTLAPSATASPPKLVATAEEIDREHAAVRAAGIDPDRPFRLLVLAPAGDPRSWPIVAMRREVRERDIPALWLAGPAERGVSLPAGVACIRHASPEIRRLIALGKVVAAAGGEVLGPDVGATHVLTATGARTLALYGPQDPQRTAPQAARVRVAALGPPCRPCRKRVCHHPDGAVCMDFTVAESVEGVGPSR